MPHDMGIGKLGSDKVIFIRKFRYLFYSEHLAPHYNTKCLINWTNKTMKLNIYEIVVDGKVPVLSWVESMEQGAYPEEILHLVTLDGCGNELYHYEFSGIKITERKNGFDYASSEVSEQEIDLSFNFYRSITPEKNVMPVKDVPKNPEGPLHQTEINYLNAKAWIV